MIKDGVLSYIADEIILQYDETKEYNYPRDTFLSFFAPLNVLDSFDEFNKINQILSQIINQTTQLIEIKNRIIEQDCNYHLSLFKDLDILQQDFLTLVREEQKEILREMLFRDPHFSQLTYTDSDVIISQQFLISVVNEINAKKLARFYSQQSRQSLFPPSSIQTIQSNHAENTKVLAQETSINQYSN